MLFILALQYDEMAAPEEGKLELGCIVKFGSRSGGGDLWMNTILKVVL